MPVYLLLAPCVPGNVAYRIAAIDHRKDDVVVPAAIQPASRAHRKQVVVVVGEAPSLQVRMREGSPPVVRQGDDAQFVVHLFLCILQWKQHVGGRRVESDGLGRQQIHPAEAFEQPLQGGRRTAAREAVCHEGLLAGGLPTDVDPELPLLAAERTPGDKVFPTAVRPGSELRPQLRYQQIIFFPYDVHIKK